MLACRKLVFLEVSSCYFQTSLDGCLICIHISHWHLQASEPALVRVILAICVRGHNKLAYARQEVIGSIVKKNAKDFNVIEVVVEGTGP